MLRISKIETDNEAGLRLQGRVIGPWVQELHKSCEQILAEGDGLTLDLAEVSFVDRQGIALIRNLMHRQVKLVRCPLFVTEQLKGEAREP